MVLKRVSVAAEALLRSTSHPHRNSTINVLSSGKSHPTDQHWEDQFLKIDGPEVSRTLIRFASKRQVVVALFRAATAVQRPGSGLVTPIEVTKFSNGIRIVFRPSISPYTSSKEEKRRIKMEEAFKDVKQQAKARTSLYLSPEEEERIAKASTESKESETSGEKVVKQLFEGGLEVVVEESPYRRVRIIRCNMGPNTLVKEESEKLLLKSISQALVRVENDYKILMEYDKNN